jgi:hypothetical protein
LASAVALGGLLLAACGSVSKVSTQHAVSQSLSKLGGDSSVSVSISLGLSASQVQQLAASGGKSTMTAQQAQAISQGSIFFAEQSGRGEPLSSKQAATDSANKYDFGLRVGSAVPIEIRYVGQAAYLHVQLSQLTSAVGAPSSISGTYQSSLAQADKYVPGLSALAQGQWVEVSKSSLQPLLGLVKQLGAAQSTSTGSANSNLARTDVAKLRTDLAASLKNNATYKNDGTTGGRTEYTATLAVQPFLTQLSADLQSDLASLPGGVGTKYASGLSSAKAKIPAAQTAVFQVYVHNGKTEEIDVNVNQFVPKAGSPVIPVRLVFNSSTAITAPSGATQLDLSKLPSLLGGLAGSLGGSSSSSSSG